VLHLGLRSIVSFRAPRSQERSIDSLGESVSFVKVRLNADTIKDSIQIVYETPDTFISFPSLPELARVHFVDSSASLESVMVSQSERFDASSSR